MFWRARTESCWWVSSLAVGRCHMGFAAGCLLSYGCPHHIPIPRMVQRFDNLAHFITNKVATWPVSQLDTKLKLLVKSLLIHAILFIFKFHAPFWSQMSSNWHRSNELKSTRLHLCQANVMLTGPQPCTTLATKLAHVYANCSTLQRVLCFLNSVS